MRKAAPASVRMMDNLQFQLGHCLAPEDNVRYWGHKPGRTGVQGEEKGTGRDKSERPG